MRGAFELVHPNGEGQAGLRRAAFPEAREYSRIFGEQVIRIGNQVEPRVEYDLKYLDRFATPTGMAQRGNFDLEVSDSGKRLPASLDDVCLRPLDVDF